MPKKLFSITPGDVLLEEFLKPMGFFQNQLARDLNLQLRYNIKIAESKE